MSHKYIECDCTSAEHVVRIGVANWGDDYPCLVIETQLSHYTKWYERFWLAIKYVFGYKHNYGHWAETQLTGPEVKKLRDVCNEHLEEWEKYNDKRGSSKEVLCTG